MRWFHRALYTHDIMRSACTCRGFTEHSTSGKWDGRHALCTSFTENAASAKTEGGHALRKGLCSTERERELLLERNGYSDISLAQVYIRGLSPLQLLEYFYASTVLRSTGYEPGVR